MIPIGEMGSAAIAYAKRAYRIFPCWPLDKTPIGKAVPHGFKDATDDPVIVASWWRQYPQALIGTPTGRDAGVAVFDIDVKDGKNGFETLVDLGLTELPKTPMVRTRTGGMHLYLKPPGDRLISNSVGLIGSGLDWRGEGGYVILPGPGSGYEWLEGTRDLPLAEIPAVIMPKPRVEPIIGPARTCDRLTEYGKRKLFEAVENILAAPNGEQESTLTWQVRLIGRMASSGDIPADFALKYLLLEIAGGDDKEMPLKSYAKSVTGERRRPWDRARLRAKIAGAFARGLALPFPDMEEIERQATRMMEEWVDE